MRTLLASTALLVLPLSALANDAPCKFTERRDLALQLGDAKTLVLEVNQHDLRVTAAPGSGALSGRACASKAEWLPELTLTQRRDADKLIVTLRREGRWNVTTGSEYAWLDIGGSIPDSVRVQLKVGSGDAEVTGAQSLSVDVGSGDALVRTTRGSVHAAVGSGDLDIDGAERLDLLSLGSGDVDARNIRRDVHVGTVGSGDLKLRDIGGLLKVETVGSGDVEARTVGGNVEVGTVGSGDLDLQAVAGNVTVARHGSGNVNVHGVGGNLTVQRSGSGDVRQRDVRGQVNVPKP